MPRFYGSLKASPNQEELQELLSKTGVSEGMTGATSDLASNLQIAQSNIGALTPSHTEQDPAAVVPDGEVWKPSGGKMLSTGLMLAISNAAAGITRPCVLDLKLGARLWDDEAPIAKRRKLDEVSAETTSGSLGFRVAGMKVWVPPTSEEEGGDAEKEEHCEVKDGYRSYGKNYGRDFNSETVRRAFETFLGGLHEGKLKRKHAELLRGRFVREVEKIEDTLNREEIRMYSASILMVYEGDDEMLERALKLEGKMVDGKEEDEEEDEGEEDDEAEPKVLEAILIDFAHAKFTPGEGPDENALQGVRSVLDILRGLA